MKTYYRVMLGKGCVYAAECFGGGFIGADFDIKQDLTGQLPDEWRDFNHQFIPVYRTEHPDKSKIAAGLACGFLWTVAKGIATGDTVLCPDGNRCYRVGEVTGDYYYAPGQILPHRRPVRWFDVSINRDDMSDSLRNSAGSIGTVCELSRAGFGEELARLIGVTASSVQVLADNTVEDPSAFALEKHLEDFLVQNWTHTELGKQYDIYQDENGTGQQYQTDVGPIDILAVSKDKRKLLVIELKRGRISDVVVGQIQRYMGYIQEEIAEADQQVEGVIIALEDDLKLRYALKVARNISFYRYQINFKLLKG